MNHANNILLVFLGGGTGAALRYLASVFIKNNSTGFPLATFFVNVTGCLLIGLLYSVLSFENQTMKLLLIIGLLGGFTTFSSFGIETIQLFKNAQYQTAVFYVILSNICGLAAVYFGVKLSGLLV